MHRVFLWISRTMAAIGGLVLSAIILLVCVSILGRSLNGLLNGALLQSLAPDLAGALLATGIGPVEGDYEILEAGIAFVIFAFLPLCQITNGHAAVDLLSRVFPPAVQRLLLAAGDVALAIVLVVIAWQLEDGMQSKIRSGQTTFLLQFPVWWGYALSLFAAAVAALVGVYVGAARVVECATGRQIVGGATGANH
jgi:TRAP-type C4-dicarboxylate transport system permease small subunit